MLAGAQSDEVCLDKVEAAPRMVFSAGLKDELANVQIIGFIWFELLMAASYLGACAGLLEMAISRNRWNAADQAALGCAFELSHAALLGFAHEFERRQQAGVGTLDDMLGRLLMIRYGIEAQLAQASDMAHEMLGGISFITSQESSARLLSVRGLRFHPPARVSMNRGLAEYLRGGAFSMAPPVALRTLC